MFVDRVIDWMVVKSKQFKMRYKCKRCGTSFRWKSDLKAHMEWHKQNDKGSKLNKCD